jgi:hypothetical protein
LHCKRPQRQLFCKIRYILNHGSSLQSYFGFFQWLSWYPMGLPSTLKIRKTIIQQTSWAGWQHPDDKWSEAVLDPLPFTGLESYQTWWWTRIGVLQ